MWSTVGQGGGLCCTVYSVRLTLAIWNELLMIAYKAETINKYTYVPHTFPDVHLQSSLCAWKMTWNSFYTGGSNGSRQLCGKIEFLYILILETFRNFTRVPHFLFTADWHCFLSVRNNSITRHNVSILQIYIRIIKQFGLLHFDLVPYYSNTLVSPESLSSVSSGGL